jgi:hypothetical protein
MWKPSKTDSIWSYLSIIVISLNMKYNTFVIYFIGIIMYSCFKNWKNVDAIPGGSQHDLLW